MKLYCHLAAIFAALTLPLSAQQMSYQGRLTDNTGAALIGPTAQLAFSVWDSATGGTKVWGDQSLNADLIDGRFSVKLGPTDASSRQLSSSFTGNRFIQIQVGSNAPLPRQEMLSSPAAFSSQNAAALGGPGFKTTIGRRPTIGTGGNIPAFQFGTADGLLIETGFAESSGMFFNKDTVALYSPGNGNLFTIYDEDDIDGAGDNFLPAFVVGTFGQITAGKPGSIFPSNFNGGINTTGGIVANGTITASSGITATGRILLNSPNPGTTVALRADGQNEFPFSIWDRNNSLYMQCFASNSATGSGQFLINYGTAFKQGGGSWASISDARVKKNVTNLEGSLAKLSSLRPVSFEYTNGESHGAEGAQIGFIAQEVEEVFPQWVKEMPNHTQRGPEDVPEPDTIKQLSITGFEALTVAAFQELRAEQSAKLEAIQASSQKSIEALQSENEELKSRLKRLEDRLSRAAQ